MNHRSAEADAADVDAAALDFLHFQELIGCRGRSNDDI